MTQRAILALAIALVILIGVPHDLVAHGVAEGDKGYLQEVSGGRTVRRVARPRSATPAEGSAARHAINQQALVDRAFGEPPKKDGAVAKSARQNSQLTSSKG